MAFAAVGIRFFKPIATFIVFLAGLNFVLALSEFERTGLVLSAFVLWFLVDHREKAAQKRHEELLKAIADLDRDLSSKIKGRKPLDGALLERIVDDLQRPTPPPRQTAVDGLRLPWQP